MLNIESDINLASIWNDLDYNNLNIPIERHSIVEYEICPYCSLVYDIGEDREYVSYIDLITGEDIEEDINSFDTITIEHNKVTITLEQLSEFYNIVVNHKKTITI